MSGTQAKINKLRLIRRKMQQEIKEIEVAVAEKERGRRSHAKQDREVPSTRVSQKALDNLRISRNRAPENEVTNQRPAASRQTKPKIDQEFNLYLLTRNLILATSNRQIKRAFRVWRKKLEAKRKAVPRRVTNIPPPPKRRVVKQAPKPVEVHVVPYAFKPRDERKKVDRDMLTAAYERVGQVDWSSDSDYDIEELVQQLRENEFAFTPEPAEAPQRQVRESPVAGNARTVVNAQPKKQVSMIRESGSSDIGEFIELENEVDDTSSKSTERVDSESESESLVKEAPIPSAYPDELVKRDVEEGSMMTVSALGTKPKDEDEDGVVDGYIEESFSRETSPKSIVKKNFSGSLKDKLEDAVTSFSKSLPSPSPRKSPAQREMLSSGSPRRATPSPRVFASTSPAMRQSESFGTPRRSGHDTLEETDIVQPSRRSFGKSSPSPARNSLNQSFEPQSLERTTPRSIKKSTLLESHSSTRSSARKSPVRVLHSSDEEIVKEVPSPYSVKQGDYLSNLLSEEPKETFHINDDGAAVEEPTEYSVKKRSSPSKSFMSSSSNMAWAKNPAASDDSSDETEVVKASFDSSLHAISKQPRVAREPTYIAASSSESEDFHLPTRSPAHKPIFDDDYEEELDDELYEEFVNMKISSSSSAED